MIIDQCMFSPLSLKKKKNKPAPKLKSEKELIQRQVKKKSMEYLPYSQQLNRSGFFSLGEAT